MTDIRETIIGIIGLPKFFFEKVMILFREFWALSPLGKTLTIIGLLLCLWLLREMLGTGHLKIQSFRTNKSVKSLRFYDNISPEEEVGLEKDELVVDRYADIITSQTPVPQKIKQLWKLVAPWLRPVIVMLGGFVAAAILFFGIIIIASKVLP